MTTPEITEIKSSRNLQNVQAGAPFDAYNRGARIRHAMLDSWWERGLALITAACLAVAFVSYVVRTFFR